MTRRGEWLGVAFWAALGAAIFVAAWRMDRLGHQGISPWSAPGLLPGVVGAAMIVFALGLAVQTWLAAAPVDSDETDIGVNSGANIGVDRNAAPNEPLEPSGRLGSSLAALMGVLFAGASLGRGWPFQLEAALFIVTFTAVFSWRAWRAEGRLARGLMVTAVVATVAALAIGALFEWVFLVRLP
jgi:hypothetical protein